MMHLSVESIAFFKSESVFMLHAAAVINNDINGLDKIKADYGG
jgi:hypothetical protein